MTPRHRPPSRRGVRLAVLGAGLLLCVAAPSVLRVWRPTPARNLLLITIDTLRADRLPCYGYAKNATPRIDALAARGIVFEHAFCDVPWTTPSMASVFTGLYATHHGVRALWQPLEETRTLAKLLRARGYTTAAVIGSFPVDSMFGLQQGFDLYDEDFNTSLLKDDDAAKLAGVLPDDASDMARNRWLIMRRMDRAYRPDDQVAARVVRWLRSERREPFFLWVHFFGPHERMYMHLSHEELWRRSLAEYDPDVAFVDAQVGVVLDALRDSGAADQTLVVLHADHGQSLLEHNFLGHGPDLYEPALHIPLIIAEPQAGAARTAAFARNIDILPTVLDLLGLPLPAGLDGHSLRIAVRYPWLARLRRMNEGDTYAETYLSATGLYPEMKQLDGRQYVFGFVRRGVRTERWKYVESEPVPLLDDPTSVLPAALVEQQRSAVLYDLVNDPLETADTSAQHPDVAKRLRGKLQAYEQDAHTAPDSPLDEASKERLRSLGYLPSGK